MNLLFYGRISVACSHHQPSGPFIFLCAYSRSFSCLISDLVSVPQVAQETILRSTFGLLYGGPDEENLMNSQLSGYISKLCSALKTDYKLSQMRGHFHAIKNTKDEHVKEYHRNQIKEILKGKINFDVEISHGKKYVKLVIVNSGSRSVHCFIDNVTGDVFKPASWAKPAKNVRYNLLNDQSRSLCYEKADWAGGYLYMR